MVSWVRKLPWAAMSFRFTMGNLNVSGLKPGPAQHGSESLASMTLRTESSSAKMIQFPVPSFFSRQREFNHGQFTFQFRRQDHTATQDDQGLGFGLGHLQHVFELPDEDGVGVLEEEVKIPEQNQGFLLQVPYGGQGFQRVVGGVVGGFLGVNKPIHDRPEDQVVFEFLGDSGHFESDPLFFVRDQIKPRIARTDVVDDLGFDILFLSCG